MDFLSGLRMRHSTETKLVNVTNNLLAAAEKRIVSALILFGPSASLTQMTITSYFSD